MDEVTDWLKEIKAAQKREKDFREKGREIAEIYEGKCYVPYNILYSNTETMLPALFSELPKPVVKRRFDDDDPLGKAVSESAQRLLEYLIDKDINEADKDEFYTAIEGSVLDGLLPGRGITMVKYDADIDEDEEDEESIPEVKDEIICVDHQEWDKVYFGYAKKWSNVPWIAYELFLDKEECEKLKFDEAVLKELVFSEGETNEEENEEGEKESKRETALVYQIWDKSDRKVKYISPQYKNGFLKITEDPLNLSGFFNIPEPLQFVIKTKNLIPTPLYSLYENQAEELNKIQTRLNRVISAIKARGLYDGQLGDEIQNLLKEDDNALIPTEQGASLMAQGGLDKAIWMLPIDKLITVAQALVQTRESSKRVVYEITGISDIIRGQSIASETLGAQQIKEAWGTMRLKRLQKRVQRYVLDLLKLMLEVASKKLSEKAWQQMTGLPYPLGEQKEQAVQLIKLAAQQGQQPDPQAMQIAQMPSWREILEVLKNDELRSYRVDIETNSTLDVEATEDKKNVAEFMNALAQFMNGIGPMIADGTISKDVAKSLLLSLVRRFRFGRDVEDQLKQMGTTPQQNQKQIQEAKKMLVKEKQSLAKEKQKLEEQRTIVGQNLDDQHNKFQLEKAKFEFDKKLAAIEAKYREDLQQIKQKAEKDKISAELQSQLDGHLSKVQSLLDKQAARIKRG